MWEERGDGVSLNHPLLIDNYKSEKLKMKETIPVQTKQNSLYLTIKQVYFDAILNGTKDKEYRSISPTTVTKYIESRRVDGDIQLLYFCSGAIFNQFYIVINQFLNFRNS